MHHLLMLHTVHSAGAIECLLHMLAIQCSIYSRVRRCHGVIELDTAISIWVNDVSSLIVLPCGQVLQVLQTAAQA